MFGSDLRDKDGVAASVVFAEFVTSLQRQGKTASSRLKELYEQCVLPPIHGDGLTHPHRPSPASQVRLLPGKLPSWLLSPFSRTL